MGTFQDTSFFYFYSHMTWSLSPRMFASSPGLTCQEADPPEAWVQGHAYVGALVERQDDAFLQVEPVVGADGHPQQAQAAHCQHTAQQRQCLPPTHAHAAPTVCKRVPKQAAHTHTAPVEAHARNRSHIHVWTMRTHVHCMCQYVSNCPWALLGYWSVSFLCHDI